MAKQGGPEQRRNGYGGFWEGRQGQTKPSRVGVMSEKTAGKQCEWGTRKGGCLLFFIWVGNTARCTLTMRTTPSRKRGGDIGLNGDGAAVHLYDYKGGRRWKGVRGRTGGR